MNVEAAISIVEQVIEQGQLNKVQELVFRQAWEGRSYLEIARASGYDMGYIKDTGSKLWQTLSEIYGIKITKINCQPVLKRVVDQIPASANQPPKVQSVKHRTDWGDAIDVSIFYGRDQELTTLQT